MLKVTRLRMVRKTVLLGSAAAASAFTPAPSATLFGQPQIARARAATGTANLRAEEGFRDTIGKMFGMQQKVGRGIKKGHLYRCIHARTHTHTPGQMRHQRVRTDRPSGCSYSVVGELPSPC